MPDLCVEYTFGSLVINDQDPDADRLVLEADGALGLDGAPIRRQVDPRGQTSGSLVFEGFFASRIIVFKGAVNIGSVDQGVPPSSAYLSALMNLQDSVKATLQALLNTPTALTWTQSNGNAESITCVYGMPGGEIQFPGDMVMPKFQFTLVEASEIID